MPIPEKLRQKVIRRAGHVLAGDLYVLLTPSMTDTQMQEIIDRELDRRMQQLRNWEKEWIAKHEQIQT